MSGEFDRPAERQEFVPLDLQQPEMKREQTRPANLPGKTRTQKRWHTEMPGDP